MGVGVPVLGIPNCALKKGEDLRGCYMGFIHRRGRSVKIEAKFPPHGIPGYGAGNNAEIRNLVGLSEIFP